MARSYRLYRVIASALHHSYCYMVQALPEHPITPRVPQQLNNSSSHVTVSVSTPNVEPQLGWALRAVALLI
jgi:hypothetical protein